MTLAPADCGGAVVDSDFGSATASTDSVMSSIFFGSAAACRRFASTQRLLIYPTREKTAVNDEYLSGYETGRIRGQEDCRTRKFLNLAKPLHRRAHEKLATTF